MTVTAETKQIAITILHQIGSETLACIGMPRDSIAIIPETIGKNEDGHLGGVTFKFTNCPKVRNGRVMITLSGDDTYHVQIFNNRGRSLYDEKGIYCDSLGGRDGVIERVTG